MNLLTSSSTSSTSGANGGSPSNTTAGGTASTASGTGKQHAVVNTGLLVDLSNGNGPTTTTTTAAASTATTTTTSNNHHHFMTPQRPTHMSLPYHASSRNESVLISSPYPAAAATSSYYYQPQDEQANKAFDDVVFDVLRVDPDVIAGQLTLIDAPLFKAIEPEELISCKWMSREKLTKAPNIVQFTRRFNQTTFWCQKEILNCKRIEKRGKMISHFIKIAKRLYELHSFNSLMAIIVGLKSAPIWRLKRTWSSQYVPKRDLATFERLADIMFDTQDNKRKNRDMHMNCRLPCIPFLGLFLTDLIHIDIAHPHNSFDNPQRRNQMNNICRIISEYQQSNYQDTSSLCTCADDEDPQVIKATMLSNDGSVNASTSMPSSGDGATAAPSPSSPTVVTGELEQQQDAATITSGCVLHGSSRGARTDYGGGGIINSDGTMYIKDVAYVQNYLNSFLYIEELQKFKEDENYRISLDVEPDPSQQQAQQQAATTPASSAAANDGFKFTNVTLTPIGIHVTTNKAADHMLKSYSSAVDAGLKKENNAHRKTNSLATNSLFPAPPEATVMDNAAVAEDNSNDTEPPQPHLVINLDKLSLEFQQQQQQQQQEEVANEPTPINNEASPAVASINSVNSVSSSSLLKNLLKHRHSKQEGTSKPKKQQLSCYSSSRTADDSDLDQDQVSNNNNSDDVVDTTSKSSRGAAGAGKHNVQRSLSHRTEPSSSNNKKKNSTSLTIDEDRQSQRSSNTGVSVSMASSSSTSIHQPTAQLFHPSMLQQVLFESPVKRKCLHKQFRKPRFSAWKTYWLQLCAGDLLVYYASKAITFHHQFTSNNSSNNTTTAIAPPTERPSADQFFSEHRRLMYQKQPCKMHRITNWMVVNCFADKAAQINEARNRLLQVSATGGSTKKKEEAEQLQRDKELVECTKFDVQLTNNDGTVYKYRFDTLELAQEWLVQFNAAATYQERQKPDNLIKFD